MESSIMVTLKSYDGEAFEVPEAVAKQSRTIRHMMELDDSGQDVFFPLPNVSAKVLAKVIKYCKWRVDVPSNTSDEDKKEWEKQFLDVDQKTIFELIQASNYLDIQALLELTCQAVADMIKGNSPEEVREIFNIKNDFTPEEEEEIRRENQWAFESCEENF